MFRLDSKVVIVTGSNGLLGRALMESLEKSGALAIGADLADVQPENDRIHKVDVSDVTAVRQFVAQLIDKYGRIDGWVNNAYPRTADWGLRFEDIPDQSWRTNVDTHLNGYCLCAQVVLEQMKRQRSGSFINLGSIYGVMAPNFSLYAGTSMTMPAAYAAIKGGIINFTRYLAAYYGPYDIRVNCVSPGGIFDHQPESFVKKYEERAPLRRMAKPQDITPTIVFLLTEEASYITGQNILVDGGISIV